jgi:hypothetical protein
LAWLVVAVEVDIHRDAGAVPVEDHRFPYVLDAVRRYEAGVADELTKAQLNLLMPETEHHDFFATALEHLDAVAAPFEVARTHLCHGERLRRAVKRTAARRALRVATASSSATSTAAP